jgi:hypothetical protein
LRSPVARGIRREHQAGGEIPLIEQWFQLGEERTQVLAAGVLGEVLKDALQGGPKPA